MICRKCGKEFSDDMDNCPFCLEPTKIKNKKFVVNVPQNGDSEGDDSVFSLDRRQEYSKSFIEHENNTYEQGAVSVDTDEEENSQTYFFDNNNDETAEEDAEVNAAELEEAQSQSGAEDGNDAEEETAKPETQEEISDEASAEQKKTSGKKKRAPKPPESKKAKKAFLTIKIMVAVCAVLMVALTVVGAVTPIFKNSAGVNKTVALKGLSKEAVASFEEIAPGFCGFAEDGYDSSTINFDMLVPYLAPDSDSGIIASLSSKKKVIKNQPDPLERFSDGDSFAYVSVSKKVVHQTAELLGISVVDDINTSGCYYYDGMYYFAPSEQEDESEKKQVKVTSSKQTQDGKYYIECALYPETAQKDKRGNFSVEPESNAYFIVECEKNGDGFDWAVKKISSTPLFDQTGAEISEEETDGLAYEMKKKTFKAVTSEGQVYAKYIIEYPHFTSEGVTQSTVNTLYNELVTSYQQKSKTADSLYEKYKKSGADEAALPLTVHVVSTVTFNERGYLSLIERTTQDDPTAVSSTETSSQTTTAANKTTGTSESESGANTAVKHLPETKYEGYTFEVESGDFVQKDDVLGKDYQAVQKLLFESYIKDENQEKTDGEEPTTQASSDSLAQTQSSDIADTRGIGQAIYASAWSLLPDGIGFFYQPENGGLETVVLGYNKLDTNIFD